MATQLPRELLSKMGIEALTAEQALNAMELALEDGSCQTILADVDWGAFKAFYSARHQPLFDLIGPPEATQRKQTKFLAQLREASPAARELQLTTYLRETASTLLGVQLREHDNGVQFTQLGMDSLIAMELRNTIQAHLGINVDVALFLQDIDLRSCAGELSKLLNEELDNNAAALAERHEDRELWRQMANGQRVITPTRANDLLAVIDHFSEQEVIDLLTGLDPDHESAL